MTIIDRPASVRELLECLPRQTLIYLCELRELQVSRSNYDCRSSIARSFRGKRDEFLGVLRKPELVLLLSHAIRDGDDVLELTDAERFTKRELLELAIQGFGRTRELGRPFRPHEAAVESTDSRTSDPPAEPDSVSADEEALLEPDSARSTAPAGAGWSRPRPLKGLLVHVGLPVPAALDQDEFSALIEALENRGYEIATVAGERLTPLHDALAIEDEVRLRHDAIAVPTTSLRGASVSPGGRTEAPAELSDYAVAALRLELLTTGFGGGASAPLIASCVEIAAAGLPLDGTKRALLEQVARRLVRTPRDPVEVLTSLVQRLDREDGEVLLREYRGLHRPGDELAAILTDHWAALTGDDEGSDGATEPPPAGSLPEIDVAPSADSSRDLRTSVSSA